MLLDEYTFTSETLVSYYISAYFSVLIYESY